MLLELVTKLAFQLRNTMEYRNPYIGSYPLVESYTYYLFLIFIIVKLRSYEIFRV